MGPARGAEELQGESWVSEAGTGWDASCLRRMALPPWGWRCEREQSWRCRSGARGQWGHLVRQNSGKGHRKEKHPFSVAIQLRVVGQGSFLEDVTPEPSLGNACSW